MGSGSVILKQKKRVKHAKNKYLKPGALAQIRYTRSTSRDIGKKRILLNAKDELEISPQAEVLLESTAPILSPARLNFEPFGSNKGLILPKTPRTPDAAEFDGDSRLESLPLDLLVWNWNGHLLTSVYIMFVVNLISIFFLLRSRSCVACTMTNWRLFSMFPKGFEKQ